MLITFCKKCVWVSYYACFPWMSETLLLIFVPVHIINFFYKLNGKIVPVFSAPELCGWRIRAFAHLFLVYCSSQDGSTVASKSSVFGLTWNYLNVYIRSKIIKASGNCAQFSTALLWNNYFTFLSHFCKELELVSKGFGKNRVPTFFFLSLFWNLLVWHLKPECFCKIMKCMKKCLCNLSF